MELPRQVIRQLWKYLETGCTLEVVTEDFNGEPIQRWIANGNYVLWSTPLETKADTQGTNLLTNGPKANSRTSDAQSGAGEKGRL